MDDPRKFYAKWKNSGHKISHIVWSHVNEMFGIGKSIGIERRVVVAYIWKIGIKGGVIAKEQKFIFWCNGNVLKLIVAVVAQLCEHNKTMELFF